MSKLLLFNALYTRFFIQRQRAFSKKILIIFLWVCGVNSSQTSAQTYCEPYSGYSYGLSSIYQVIAGGLNLTYSNAYLNSGYYAGNVIAANYGTQTVSISTRSVGTDSQLSVFFDYNNDGDFYDAGEMLMGPTSSPNYTMNNVSLNIPTDIVPGIHRLRIVTQYYHYSTDPCNNEGWGTVQDYPVNLVCPDQMFADSDSDGYGSATGVSAVCPIPNGFVLNNSDCDDTEANVHPGAAEILGNHTDDNCNGSTDELTFCTPYNSHPQYAISGVTVGTINNFSGPFSNTSYSDFSNMSTVAYAGSNQTLSVNSFPGNTSIFVYLDYNNDGDFYDAGELVASASNVSTFNGNFTIPANTLLGEHRLRVINSVLPFANPCTTFQGEVEDYTINIVQAMYADADGDGYGAGTMIAAISPTPSGYSLQSGDCDDNNAAMHESFLFYADTDHDGYGTGELILACATNATTPPAGFATNNTDCDNDNPLVFQSTTLYIDADLDEFTDGNTQVVCYGATVPSGYLTSITAIDCNDGVASIHPNAVEIPYNGVDDDCDNVIDETGTVTTSLLVTSCGATLPAIGSLIQIQTVAGHPITGYRIKLTNGAQVQIIERFVPHFTMPMFASYTYATTYTVEVQLQRSGIWMHTYGAPCLVSTPAILENGAAGAINPSQCGITLSQINTPIATSSLAGVTGYRFRITNLTDTVGPNAVQTLDRVQHWFTLQMLSRYNYGTKYRVEVAVKTTESYGGFGAPCEVSSPLVPSLINCGGSVSAGTTLVKANSVAGATQYRFQVVRIFDNALATIDRSNNYFTFNMVPALAFSAGEGYAVRAAVMTTGTWSPYGDACEITAPGGTAKGAMATSQVSNEKFNATAMPNPFTADFNIDITGANQNSFEVKVYDMLGRLIETKTTKVAQETEKLGNNYPSGVYNIIVTEGDNVKTLRVIKR